MAFGFRSQALAGIFVFAAVSIARPDDVRKAAFTDLFDAAGAAVWQPFPSAAKVAGGVATIAPPEGQQWLASASRFQYGELEMSVRFNRLSADSTIFYYLGFQNLTPWARQVCWLQVQDAQMNVVVTKDGTSTINVPVVSGLKTGHWYRLKLHWTAAAVIVSVDGRVVFSSAERRHGLSSAGRAAEIVPAAPMHVFLAANTLDAKKGIASLAAGEDLRLWLRVRNSGPESRRLQTVFPIVGRVRTDGTLRGLRYFYPWRSGVVGDVDAYLMNEYGNLAWMQLMCAFDPASGAAFSLYPRDSSGEVKGLILKKHGPEPGPVVRHCEVILQEEVPPAEPLDFDQGLGMACCAIPRSLAPGGELKLPEASLSVYSGDWKPALADYARWVRTWYRHVATPAWFRDCYGYFPCHPPYFYSYERNKYTCADNLRGNEHILQWSYWDDYTHNPADPACYLDPRVCRPGDFEVNRQRGGLPAFREEIRRIREKGSRFTVYLDHRFCWSGTKTYDAHAKDWTAHYRPGVPGVYRTRDEVRAIKIIDTPSGELIDGVAA